MARPRCEPSTGRRSVGQQERRQSRHQAVVRHRSDISHLGRTGARRRAQAEIGRLVSFSQCARHPHSTNRTEQSDEGHSSHHPNLVRCRTGPDVGQPRRRARQGDGHAGRVSYQPAFDNVSATLASDRKRLSVAVDIVRTHGHLSGNDMAKQMDRCGHPMSEHTGLRWRDRAEEHRRQQHQALVPAS